MAENDSQNGVYQDYKLMIGITIGEPAGIGPDIILKLFHQQPNLFSSNKTIIFGNRQLLQERAAKLNLSSDILALSIIDIALTAPCMPGQLNPHNAAFVIDMLTIATQYALSQKISAIVTAPIHKGLLNDAGFAIAGHTDFFAKKTQSHPVMMLMNKTLKIALFSDHLPLRAVPDYLTQENLTRCLQTIIHDFQYRLHVSNPRVLMCGLNPHAGEQGYLGHEEKTIMEPVIQKFRAQGYTITGPIGADVAFTTAYQDHADVILAMYHDQGLPVIKYADFEGAINVTLGLPFLRTSVDHGTALDIAGTPQASPKSLLNAIQFAQEISS